MDVYLIRDTSGGGEKLRVKDLSFLLVGLTMGRSFPIDILWFQNNEQI